MSLSETLKMHETRLTKLFFLMIVFFLMAAWQNSQAQDKVVLQPKDSTQKAMTIYYLKFSLEKPLPADAVFVFLFDDAFDLSNAEVAGSSTINGGFALKKDGQKLMISRTGIGDTLPPNKKAELKFALIKNPDNPGNNFAVDVEIDGGDAGVLLKKSVTVSITPKK
ncbi:hypothetical protein B6D60_06295 [candidate division KSB1 bacterium 4484_87]|nr:MAG: hypothetical protein B6D60_06295 [candidate division KSB1 bacterium 4484_87]